MKSILIRTTLVLTVALVCLWSRSSDVAVSAAEPGAKNAQFAQVFGDWKALLSELRDLKNEYRDADLSRQGEIKTRYSELVEKGPALESHLLDVAKAALVESPGTNEEVSQYLVQTAAWLWQMDNHEKALPLAELLIENGVEKEAMYEVAGTAAASIAKWELAEKYLNSAKEGGTLSGKGQQCLSELAYYKDAWAKELKIRAAEAEADDLPRVLMKTNEGDIVIEMFENEAPNTVANFIFLVEQGYYNGITFHRVLPGFMAQGGCPEGTGKGGPGYKIPCECHREDRRTHFRGTLSMAHAGRDTGGSQFFLTFVPTRHLDGVHTAFGRMISGFEVLSKLQRRNPEDPNAPLPDKIIEAKVLRKRDHEYEPAIVPPR